MRKINHTYSSRVTSTHSQQSSDCCAAGMKRARAGDRSVGFGWLVSIFWLLFSKKSNRAWQLTIILAFTFSTIISSCASKHVRPEGYLDWYKQHSEDFVSRKSVGPFGFQLTYLPPELLVMQEHGAEIAQSAQWDSLVADRGDFDYYSLRIVSKESSIPILKHPSWNIDDYQERVQYMAFKMQQNIAMLHGADTAHCALYHFERSYDVTPFSTLMLAFPRKDDVASTFLYDDQVLGLGPVMMPAHKPTPESLPELIRP